MAGPTQTIVVAVAVDATAGAHIIVDYVLIDVRFVLQSTLMPMFMSISIMSLILILMLVLMLMIMVLI